MSALFIVETQKAASWLLKQYLQSGQTLSEELSSRLFDSFSLLIHWKSKLAILQCFEYLTFTDSHKPTVEYFLRQCLMDENTFIRAWAYHGFYELASHYPEYQEEAKRFLELAQKDEPASVKARIRNILKKPKF